MICAKPIFTRSCLKQNYARADAVGNPFCSRRLRGRHHRVVLVSLIQSVIGAFHENLGPLNEGGGQETGESANDDFLEKRGLHPSFNSSDGAINCRFGTGVAVFRAMTNPVQAQPGSGDAEQMARLLELELVQKRLVWKQAKQRKKSYRSLAFLFLFLLFAACLLGFFFAFNRVNEERQSHPASATSNP